MTNWIGAFAGQSTASGGPLSGCQSTPQELQLRDHQTTRKVHQTLTAKDDLHGVKVHHLNILLRPLEYAQGHSQGATSDVKNARERRQNTVDPAQKSGAGTWNSSRFCFCRLQFFMCTHEPNMCNT